MATLYITEFPALELASLPVAITPPVAEQTVAIGGSSTQSSAFNANTGLVRLHTDSVCSIEFGGNPTASTTTARMASGTTEYFVVHPGTKVAVISNT